VWLRRTKTTCGPLYIPKITPEVTGKAQFFYQKCQKYRLVVGGVLAFVAPIKIFSASFSEGFIGILGVLDRTVWFSFLLIPKCPLAPIFLRAFAGKECQSFLDKQYNNSNTTSE
jgi:hypothetical protein